MSGTDRASASLSAACVRIPRPSRSHWSVAPATNTLPSRAYVVSAPMRHAIVARSPCEETTGARPVLSSRKHPVPYVFLAVPGA